MCVPKYLAIAQFLPHLCLTFPAGMQLKWNIWQVLQVQGSQGGHVVSSRNSIPATQVCLPPGIKPQNKLYTKCAFSELDLQGVL